MTSTVNEIGRQVTESTTIAGQAVLQVEQTDAGISELSRAAERIGDFLKLITSIAEQTNLLALNATIVSRGTSETGFASSQVLSWAQSLSAESMRLKFEVGKFLDTVRSA